MKKPFDAEISNFFQNIAPENIRDSIINAGKKDILDQSFPYLKQIGRDEYEDIMADLQVELVKLQSWVNKSNARVAIVFEGRDAAGKGGTIKRFRENLNPRSAKVVALNKPSQEEQTEWYFQRYIKHLPSAGQIVFFDRSWYNRAVIEKVFGFCSERQREQFFDQVTMFENMITQDGIILIKLWLNVGRAEQLRRFLSRESDRLKQWKLSEIDVKGLSKWDEYSSAIKETLTRTSNKESLWNIIRTDDKKRGRINAIQVVLSQIPYTFKNKAVANTFDKKIILQSVSF